MASDDTHTSTSAGSTPPGAGVVASGPTTAPGASSSQRPEVLVGAAFAGGLVAALILKRLAS